MKVNVMSLTGPALDWAVAMAQGRTEIKIFSRTRPNDRGWIEVRFNPEPKAATARFDPSENWEQGGPIIEREGIEINVRNWSPSPGCRLPGKYEWSARLCFVRQTECKQFGPTPLIAAMRCFVASVLGNEIEIPDELMRKD